MGGRDRIRALPKMHPDIRNLRGSPDLSRVDKI